eukprot:gene22062-28157_t
MSYINHDSDVYSDLDEDEVVEEEDEGDPFVGLVSPSAYTHRSTRIVESPQRVVKKMITVTSPASAAVTSVKLRPQSTMSAIPIKSNSGNVRSTTELTRGQPETRATTADSSNPSMSFRRREQPAVSASTTSAASVSTSRGKTASWIANKEWRMGEKIGSGSFGEVFQGMNNKGKLFAVKRMNMLDKSSEVDGLLSEIQLMRGFSHIHIVAYLGAWVDSVECVLYIFQEWVPGGSVAHLLKNFGPFALGVIKNYTRQILKGLAYLHSNGIIHRDIKGGNILVDDMGTVKLADFGASTKLNTFDKTQETTTIKGTPYFMAPEVLANSRYGRKGDIWAVGCTMIQMLTGEPPWKDRNLKGLVQLHLLLASWDQGTPAYTQEVSPEARHCMELCFKKDEAQRPTATQLLECDFLNEADDLDESFVISRDRDEHDPLGDSGILSGLKSEMNKAVSRSSLGLGARGGEDTVSVIERQIQDRQTRASKQKLPVNPFGNRASQQNPFSSANHTPVPVASNEDRTAQWVDGLPPSQFSNFGNSAKPSTPPVSSQSQFKSPPPSGTVSTNKQITPTHRPKYSSDVLIPSGNHSMQVMPSSGRESVGASKLNPFSRGNNAVKQNGMSSSTSEQHHNPVSSSRARPAPSSFSAVPSDAGAVRDSLMNLKKKTAAVATAAKVAVSGAKSNGHHNMSSQRDEDVTPMTDCPSDEEDEYAYSSSRAYGRGAEQDTYYTQGLHDHHTPSSRNASKHSSPYDSKQQQRQHDQGEIEEEFDYPSGREDEEDEDRRYARSRTQQHRQQTSQFSQGHSQHNSAGSSAGSSQHKPREQFSQQNSGTSVASSRGRNYSLDENEEADDDSEPELLVCSPSKVPAAGRHNQVHVPPPISLSNVRSPSNGAGPDSGRLDSGRRGSSNSTPTHTTYNGASSERPTSVTKPLSAISRSKLTPSSASSSRPSSRDQHSTLSSSQQQHLPSLTGATHSEHSDPNAWKCRACESVNTRSMDYCDSCAVVRGADGRRGSGSVIRRV